MNKLPLICITALALLSACKKEDDAPAPATGPALQIIGDPFYGIFMWEVDPTTEGYLQADNAGGYIFRGEVQNNYSLEALAADDNCRVELTSNYAPDGTLTYGIRMPGTEDWWMPILNSGELMLSQEDLGTENLPDAGTNWRWRRHTIGSNGGSSVYAFESYFYPNMYWTIQGTTADWNLIKLEEHDDPANAQGFLLR